MENLKYYKFIQAEIVGKGEILPLSSFERLKGT